MKLYFFRHAEAEDSSDTTSDFDRVLTPKGVTRTKTAGAVLAALGVRLVHLYASPRVRARQTAELLGRALNMAPVVREEMDFGFDVSAVEKLTAGLTDNQGVMFVGHEPSLSVVIGELTGGNVIMKKGGMARVDVVTTLSPPRGNLTWLIAPKVFDMLGEKFPK